MSGRLAVVGIGPGDERYLTPEAETALRAADALYGYGPYLARVPEQSGQARHASDNREEGARAKAALQSAADGANVALVSGGDPGVFAMAAAVCEAIEAGPKAWRALELSVVPGVTAMLAVAAKAGAPLGHDFCAISLSDLLMPWPAIRARIKAAAAADFVVALYNPRSARRATQLVEAAAILLEHRSPETPVFIARNLGRAGETQRVMRLDELAEADVDMLSLVLVGNRQTRIIPGDPPRLYTPRGYFDPHVDQGSR